MSRKPAALLLTCLTLLAMPSLAAAKTTASSGTIKAGLATTSGSKAIVAGRGIDSKLGTGAIIFTATPGQSGTLTSSFTAYFAGGSFHGTTVNDNTPSADGSTSTLSNGTIKITGGTGAFKGVSGSGTFKGTSAGPRYSLTYALKLTL